MAIKNKTNLTSTNNSSITDPLNKQNTAARVRGIIQDVIDSTLNSTDVQSGTVVFDNITVNSINGITPSITPTLAQTLVNGNITNGQDIIISDNDIISNSIGNRLLDFGLTAGNLSLLNSNGTNINMITMDNGGSNLTLYTTNGTDEVQQNMYDSDYQLSVSNAFTSTSVNVTGTQFKASTTVVAINSKYNGADGRTTFLINDNATASFTSENRDQPGCIISSRNTTMGAGAKNSIAIAGQQNNVGGINNVVSGFLNTTSTSTFANIVSGQGNYATNSSAGNNISGFGNSLDNSNYNSISGYLNTPYNSANNNISGLQSALYTSDANIIGGQLHSLTASYYNIVGGESNTLNNSNFNDVSGSNNKIYALSAYNNVSGVSNSLTASSTRNIVGGQSNSLSLSKFNIVEGQNNALTGVTHSIIVGENATVSNQTNMIQSSNNFSSTIGGYGKLLGRGISVNLSPTLLSNSLKIASGYSYYVRCTVIGVSAIGGSIQFKGEGIVKNVSGTTSLVSAITMTSTVSDAAVSTSTMTALANNTTDTLDLTVTGINLLTMNWTSQIDYEFIQFA